MSKQHNRFNKRFEDFSSKVKPFSEKLKETFVFQKILFCWEKVKDFLKSVGKFLKKIGKYIVEFPYKYHFWNFVKKFALTFNLSKLEEKADYKLSIINDFGEKVLEKYIARELLLYFLVSFAFFFVIFFVNQILLLAETVLSKRVPLWSVIRLIWYCFPAIIAQSAPFATLVGFLVCLGRIVTDNELLILRASGQNYRLILRPVLLIGLLISVVSFMMNDFFLPLGTIKYNRLIRNIIASNPMVEIESNSVKRLNNVTLVIGDVKHDTVNDLVIFDSSDSKNPKLIVSNESRVYKTNSKGVLMSIVMDSPIVLSTDIRNFSSYDVLTSDELTLNIFENSFMNFNGSVTPREMTSFDLYQKIRQFKKDEGFSKYHLNIYMIEFFKKYSLPFGSIFFAMLAFPLALIFGKKDGQTLGLIFGIVLSVLYWCATIIGQMIGIKYGYNAFLVMWIPNLFIGLVGIILYLGLRRK